MIGASVSCGLTVAAAGSMGATLLAGPATAGLSWVAFGALWVGFGTGAFNAPTAQYASAPRSMIQASRFSRDGTKTLYIPLLFCWLTPPVLLLR